MRVDQPVSDSLRRAGASLRRNAPFPFVGIGDTRISVHCNASTGPHFRLMFLSVWKGYQEISVQFSFLTSPLGRPPCVHGSRGMRRWGYSLRYHFYRSVELVCTDAAVRATAARTRYGRPWSQSGKNPYSSGGAAPRWSGSSNTTRLIPLWGSVRHSEASIDFIQEHVARTEGMMV